MRVGRAGRLAEARPWVRVVDWYRPGVGRGHLAGAAARVTWTDLLAVTPGREDLSIRGLEIYIALDGDALQAHNSMTEIRGAWYDGNFKIAPGGVSYPSRPRDTSRLSQFQALGGADYSIRVAFPGWYMIVQANMKAQNLSQLFTHYE